MNHLHIGREARSRLRHVHHLRLRCRALDAELRSRRELGELRHSFGHRLVGRHDIGDGHCVRVGERERENGHEEGAGLRGECGCGWVGVREGEQAMNEREQRTIAFYCCCAVIVGIFHRDERCYGDLGEQNTRGTSILFSKHSRERQVAARLQDVMRQSRPIFYSIARERSFGLGLVRCRRPEECATPLLCSPSRTPNHNHSLALSQSINLPPEDPLLLHSLSPTLSQ